MNTYQILESLVGFDTTSHLSNRSIVTWISDYLQSHGTAVRHIPNETSQKINLLARIGPDIEGGVVLSGHTDVVPADRQNWLTDPFKMTAKGSRLYGRGTADMKGFLACVLAAVPKMVTADLSVPIHIAFSCDEEVGCLGVPHIISALPRASAVIVGEPTNLKVVDRHKGAIAEKVNLTGVAAHSSLPQLGVSATEYATRLMTGLLDLAEALKQEKQPDVSSEPRYSTINIATINGGIANNIVPDAVELTWQLRTVPSQNPRAIVERAHAMMDTLAEQMRAECKTCRIDYSPLFEVPPLRCEASPTAARLCQQLTGENTTCDVNFGTEAGLFQQAGYSVAICGPGNIEQAHKPDEFIEITQLADCDRMIEKLIEKLGR